MAAGHRNLRWQQSSGWLEDLRGWHPVDVEIVKDKLTKEITGGGGDNIALAERFRERVSKVD